MKLEKVKNKQNFFKSNIHEITKRFFSEEQKSAIENTEMVSNSQNKVIKLSDDYSAIASEAKSKANAGEKIKKLSPKQMIQILPITFAQAGDTSEIY